VSSRMSRSLSDAFSSQYLSKRQEYNNPRASTARA
jgi:hypothetical protein